LFIIEVGASMGRTVYRQTGENRRLQSVIRPPRWCWTM